MIWVDLIQAFQKYRGGHQTSVLVTNVLDGMLGAMAGVLIMLCGVARQAPKALLRMA